MEPDLIDEVVAELERTHVLDDARYAERFTEDRRSLSGWGPERIELELARRGIPESVAPHSIECGRLPQRRRTVEGRMPFVCELCKPAQGRVSVRGSER